MKKIRISFILWSLGTAAVWAMPSQITFQGTLKQNGVPVNTTENMQFSFVDNTGATIPGTSPVSVSNVSVVNGLFAVNLPIDSAIPWEQYSPYIRVSVQGQILSPDQPINANLYAIAAIPQGMIAMFANGCPTGWSIFTALQGKFPVGMDNVNFTAGSQGGSLTHTHSTPDHQHPLAKYAANVNAGCFNSAVGVGAGTSGGIVTIPGGSFCAYDLISAITTVSGGSVTGSASSLPPYQTVVFCQKI